MPLSRGSPFLPEFSIGQRVVIFAGNGAVAARGKVLHVSAEGVALVQIDPQRRIINGLTCVTITRVPDERLRPEFR